MLALRTLRAAGVALCGAGLLAVACAPAPSRARDVLAGYLRWIGRDPARTLQLLSPEFHTSHGLRMADLDGVLWGGWEPPHATELPAARGVAAPTPEERLEAGRLAWVFVQRAGPPRGELRFRVKVLEQDWQDTTGFLLVRLHTGHGRPFRQRFEVSRRDASAPWRIRAIEQEDVDATNARSAFAAYPSLANLARIQQAARGGDAGPSR